jgi:hypothetical protein
MKDTLKYNITYKSPDEEEKSGGDDDDGGKVEPT